MKKILSILLLVSSLQAYSNNIDSLFQEANTLYQAENYQKAIVLYNDILNSDTHSLELHFNLGNSHYQNGNIPLSILHFEKALSLSPAHKEVIHNLSIAQQRIEKVDELPILFFEEWWQSFTLTTTPNNWSILLIISLWLGAISAIQFIASKNRKLFKLLTLSLALSLVFGMAYQKSSREQKKTFAILFTDQNIKSKSTDNSSTLQTVAKGNKVEILQSQNSWSFIQLNNGTQGWVRNTSFLEI